MHIQLRSIKGYAGFGKVYSVGKKFTSSTAIATVVFNKVEVDKILDSKHTVYYGVSVSKKTAKKAVIRNRIKRLMRESLRREAQEDNGINKFLAIKKIIISYRTAPKKPMQICLEDVLPAIKSILEQAYLYYTKNIYWSENNENCNQGNRNISN